ncbi:MAG TPA: CsgG/HfaB family protein, partial [Polyangia bacterium]|nr:CsgG/HfaB family protein [Polyangia bacterium]
MISLRLARRRARWFVVTVLMVTGALAGENAARAAAQPRVAVLDFQGTGSSKDTESLGVGLQSMLTTDLAQVSSITLVERARLRDVQK